MKADTRIRFKTVKDMDLVRKAAKLESRSMNSFMVLAVLDAAKTRLAVEKIRPSSPISEETSA